MKILKTLLTMVFAVVLILHPVKSQAAVGAIATAPAVVTAGLYIAGTGVGIAVLDVAAGLLSDPNIHYPTGLFTLFFAAPLLALGLVVLGEEKGASFAQINPDYAGDLGLTKKEIHSFNAEIDQVNALASHVDSEMTALGSNDPKVAAKIWLEVKDMVSAETFSAMVKVTSGIVQ